MKPVALTMLLLAATALFAQGHWELEMITQEPVPYAYDAAFTMPDSSLRFFRFDFADTAVELHTFALSAQGVYSEDTTFHTFTSECSGEPTKAFLRDGDTFCAMLCANGEKQAVTFANLTVQHVNYFCGSDVGHQHLFLAPATLLTNPSNGRVTRLNIETGAADDLLNTGGEYDWYDIFRMGDWIVAQDYSTLNSIDVVVFDTACNQRYTSSIAGGFIGLHPYAGYADLQDGYFTLQADDMLDDGWWVLVHYGDAAFTMPWNYGFGQMYEHGVRDIVPLENCVFVFRGYESDSAGICQRLGDTITGYEENHPIYSLTDVCSIGAIGQSALVMSGEGEQRHANVVLADATMGPQMDFTIANPPAWDDWATHAAGDYLYMASNTHMNLFHLYWSTSVEQEEQPLPHALELAPVHSPFRGGTTLRFSLSSAGSVTAEVYNVRGQRVRTLASQQYTAGQHTLAWDGRDETGHACASGVYMLRMSSAGQSLSRKIMLLK